MLAAASGSLGFLALDDDFVYFTDLNWGEVSRVPRCGGAVTTIATAQDTPLGIALDATYVYWVNQGQEYSNGSIQRAPKAGGEIETLVENQRALWSILVDGDAIYWSIKYPSSLWRQPLQGGEPTQIAPNAGGFATMALDEGHIYWAFNEVGRVPKLGGDPLLYATNVDVGWCVAVDDRSVYWTTYVGTLQMAPKEGGAITDLTPPGYQRCLALDDTHVYYTQDHQMPDEETGPGVLRVAKDGGEVEQLSTDANASSIAVDSGNIYWVGGAGVMRLSK